MNERFYFTYGLHPSYPYQGGWTVVYAPTQKQAEDLFSMVHPDREGGLLNCAFVYTEEQFFNTKMHLTGNSGAFCYEIISLERKVLVCAH